MAIQEKINGLQWPCWDVEDWANIRGSLERPKCVYFHYDGRNGKTRCLKNNFVESLPGDLKLWMETHRCPTIDEEKRLNRIADSACIQAKAAKTMAKWSKSSTLIIFLWLIVAILNLIFPDGFK